MRKALPACLAIVFLAAFVPAAVSRPESGARTLTLSGAGSFLSAEAPSDLTVPVSRSGPESRVQAWVPRDAGTKEWITLDYGPYLIHPGSDLSRMDVEVVGATGYATGFIPSVVDVNGVEQPSHEIHIHHAHWYWLDPEMEGYHRWIYGTGEERTQGSILPSAKADPRFKDGLRYGVPLEAGDRLGFLSMLHNKTAQAKLVYLRVKIEFVFGSHESLQAEGLDFRPLTPVLIGSTFNVPRTGGTFVYPMDVTEDTIGAHTNYHNPVPEAEVVPGLGQVVTIPWDGQLIIGAGHSHPGAREVVLSILGREDDPCPEDGDPFPGTTVARSRNITRGGVFPSEEFQMGLTQPGWRVYVRAGDRLALNGVYDTTNFAYPDAMSYFGMYIDRSEKPSPAQTCKVELIDKPEASAREITWTIPNQEWPEQQAMATCDRCDERATRPEPGVETNLVHIAGFQYMPGNLGFSGSPLGPPVVQKGEVLRFVNEDFAEALVRHSVTSCRAPCNGPYMANYPFHDGRFHSGALGWMWQETYVSAHDEPVWDLDTASLKKGYYTYYCQLHAWMRGGFYVR
ncbi:MAG: hypothetical protein ABR505_06590 [Actinomycetota bacterium]